MADVIQLTEGQDPPQDEDCYVVTRDPTGRFYIPDPEVGFQRSAMAAAHPISNDNRAATIQRATDYADKHGVHTVYVVA
jgi:RPA family protein